MIRVADRHADVCGVSHALKRRCWRDRERRRERETKSKYSVVQTEVASRRPISVPITAIYGDPTVLECVRRSRGCPKRLGRLESIANRPGSTLGLFILSARKILFDAAWSRWDYNYQQPQPQQHGLTNHECLKDALKVLLRNRRVDLNKTFFLK